MHKQVTCIKCGEWTFDSGDWCVFCGPCEGSYTHRLKWLIPGIIFMLFLAGCAAQSTRSFVIDGVGQDLYIRDIGGNNQQAGTSRQDADVDPGIAGKGFPHLILGGNSLAGSDHIEIRNVEGSERV